MTFCVFLPCAGGVQSAGRGTGRVILIVKMNTGPAEMALITLRVLLFCGCMGMPIR